MGKKNKHSWWKGSDKQVHEKSEVVEKEEFKIVSWNVLKEFESEVDRRTGGRGMTLSADGKTMEVRGSTRVHSYVCFDRGWIPERYLEISATLEKTKATVICLQEADDAFVGFLCMQPWTQYYIFSDRSDEHAPLTLSKVKFVSQSVFCFDKTKGKKRVTCTTFGPTDVFPHEWTLLNVHLPSRIRDGKQATRLSHMKTILNIVKEKNWFNAYIVGDCNFGDVNAYSKEQALWRHWNDQTPPSLQVTYDPINNPLCASIHPESFQGRLDRFFASSVMNPMKNVRVDSSIHCSDHYPLIGELVSTKDIFTRVIKHLSPCLLSTLVQIVLSY